MHLLLIECFINGEDCGEEINDPRFPGYYIISTNYFEAISLTPRLSYVFKLEGIS